MRNCIKKPNAAVLHLPTLLGAAADAHLGGDAEAARRNFHRADNLEVFFWLSPAWYHVHLNVVDLQPEGGTCVIPKAARDPDRSISPAVKTAVLARDGHRCRYCGLPVIDAAIRKVARRLYPDAVPWNPLDLRRQHAGFAALWLQYDHVAPHSHGGRSSVDNVVVACWLCNFGKHGYTLRQLGLSDPRLRDPVPVEWDGLERLRCLAPEPASAGSTTSINAVVPPASAAAPEPTFFPARG